MSLKIIKAGLLDTVQDGGRWGHQHSGINPGGVMDTFSSTLANALLGKEDAPVLEFHFPAPQILFQDENIICITGADFTPVINNAEIPLNTPIVIHKRDELKFIQRKKGARCYVSFYKELWLQKWLGSYSTNIKGGGGGFKGRALKGGDEINFRSNNDFQIKVGAKEIRWKAVDTFIYSNEIEIMEGKEWEWLERESVQKLQKNKFTITNLSDRMGFRLQGDKLQIKKEVQLLSFPVTFGAMQLLPNGQLIVLMADHQTTGGYPLVAHVISANLPRLAQLNPGEEVTFKVVDLWSAEEKLLQQKRYLQKLQEVCFSKMKSFLNETS